MTVANVSFADFDLDAQENLEPSHHEENKRIRSIFGRLPVKTRQCMISCAELRSSMLKFHG